MRRAFVTDELLIATGVIALCVAIVLPIARRAGWRWTLATLVVGGVAWLVARRRCRQ